MFRTGIPCGGNRYRFLDGWDSPSPFNPLKSHALLPEKPLARGLLCPFPEKSAGQDG